MSAREWLGRSRWGLIALAVLIPASVVTALSVDWFDYRNATTDEPVRVARGDVGTFVGVDYTLLDASTHAFDSEEGELVGALEGSSVLIARVLVDGTDRDEGVTQCQLVLSAPGPGDDREWTPETLVFGLDDDAETSCFFPEDATDDDPEEFEYLAVFVVPDEALDQVDLRVTSAPFGLRQVLQLDW